MGELLIDFMKNVIPIVRLHSIYFSPKLFNGFGEEGNRYFNRQQGSMWCSKEVLHSRHWRGHTALSWRNPIHYVCYTPTISREYVKWARLIFQCVLIFVGVSYTVVWTNPSFHNRYSSSTDVDSLRMQFSKQWTAMFGIPKTLKHRTSMHWTFPD